MINAEVLSPNTAPQITLLPGEPPVQAQLQPHYALGRSPKITDNIWWVYDDAAGRYVSTGIPAQTGTGGTGAVSSVNGQTGHVHLTAEDVNALAADTPLPEIPEKVSAFQNDVGYLTQHQDLSGLVQEASLADVAKTGSYHDLLHTPALPEIPENLSAFQNDVGYLTQHQDLSGYVRHEAFYFSPGEVLQFTANDYSLSGVIFSSSTTLLFGITLPKSLHHVDIDPENTVLYGNVRTARGYLLTPDRTVISGNYPLSQLGNVTYTRVSDNRMNVTITLPNSGKYHMYIDPKSTSAGTAVADNNTLTAVCLNRADTRIAFRARA